MPNFLSNFQPSTKTIILAVGFILILFSIPFSFVLVRETQVFKSKAGLDIISLLPNSTLREVPTSPLDDLKKLLNSSSSAKKSIDTSSVDPVTVSFGATLSLKIAMQGRPVDKQSGKIFVGIAEGVVKTKPTYLLTYTVDFPDSGAYEGLSLAGLTAGTIYTAYIKGPSHIDSASTFTMSATESVLNNSSPIDLTAGDLNEDNTINVNDTNILKGVIGLTSDSPLWNARADINLDKVINNLDMLYVIRNQNKTGASGVWFSPPPIASSSAQASGSAEPRGGFWLWVPPKDNLTADI
ncbi:MAG: dockerin type I repeat-containing protein [Candidatus Daviesbacteria bacterium]|nr:dockerin type I repeat-containing protein [Candidatus Daviesbacteria bacterium]